MKRLLWTMPLVVLLCACQRSGKNAGAADHPKVNLPARPDLSQKPLAEKYPDGAFSVEGFFLHAQERNGQEVTVRGVVLGADLCAPDAPCTKVPSVTLVDDPKNPRRRLTVVGTTTAQDLSELKPSSTQTLTGKVAMWSPDGRMIQMDGMLILPPPAPTQDAAGAATPKTAP